MNNNYLTNSNVKAQTAVSGGNVAAALIEIIPAALNLANSIITYRMRMEELRTQRYIFNKKIELAHKQIKNQYKALIYHLDTVTENYQYFVSTEHQKFDKIRNEISLERELIAQLTWVILEHGLPIEEKSIYLQQSVLIAEISKPKIILLENILSNDSLAFQLMLKQLDTPGKYLPGADVLAI